MLRALNKQTKTERARFEDQKRARWKMSARELEKSKQSLSTKTKKIRFQDIFDKKSIIFTLKT